MCLKLRSTSSAHCVLCRGKSFSLFYFMLFYPIVVQLLSWVSLFETPWAAACEASLHFTISWNLLKLMFIELVMPFNHLILCLPFLLLPSVFPSIRVFSNESVLLIRWPEYWGFSFSISPSREYSGLISFRIDWFDLLAVQETLKVYFWCFTFPQTFHPPNACEPFI